MSLSSFKRATLVSLVIFSLSLGVAPLATYFGTLQYLWDGQCTFTICTTLKVSGNATFAAISAVVAANIVLVAYIVTSLLEDRQSSPTSSISETKKER